MSDLTDFDVPVGHTDGEILFPPSWQGLRQQIVYLAQFGNSIQVIHAEEGGGKTAFFNHLLDTGLGTTTVGVAVAKGAGLVVFFRDVLRELGLRPEHNASLGELAVSLRGYVQTLHKERSRAVLLVDNAHHLTDSELGALVSTLQGQADAGVGLHVVLFAEPGLAARIDALQVLDVAVHDAPLPVFSAVEMAQLLKTRQVSPGQVSTEQAQRIWYQSRGLPGKALEMFQDMHPPAPTAEKIMSLRGLPIGHIAALLVLCGVLIWAFMVRQTDEAPLGEALPQTLDPVSPKVRSVQPATSPSLSQTSAPQEPGESPDLMPVSPGVVDNGQTNQEIPSSIVPSEVNLNRDAGAKIDNPVGDGIEVSDEVVNVGARQQSQPATEESAPSAPVEAAASPSITVTPTKPASVSNGHGEAPQSLATAGARKLLSLPGNGYVLQLMAASAEDKLAAYMAEQPNKANLYAYKTERGGKVLYILVEGYYADKASAQAAVLNLPSQQQKGGPWPKKIEQIHQELRKNP